jgi:hypothetical protein
LHKEFAKNCHRGFSGDAFDNHRWTVRKEWSVMFYPFAYVGAKNKTRTIMVDFAHLGRSGRCGRRLHGLKEEVEEQQEIRNDWISGNSNLTYWGFHKCQNC